MTVGVWILGDRLWQNQAAFNRTDDKSSLLGFPSAPPGQTSVDRSHELDVSQSRQNAAGRIGSHPRKSGRLALVKEVRQRSRRSRFNGFNGWTLREEGIREENTNYRLLITNDPLPMTPLCNSYFFPDFSLNIPQRFHRQV